MYLKISASRDVISSTIDNFYYNLSKNEKIKNIEVIDEDNLLILIDKGSKLHFSKLKRSDFKKQTLQKHYPTYLSNSQKLPKLKKPLPGLFYLNLKSFLFSEKHINPNNNNNNNCSCWFYILERLNRNLLGILKFKRLRPWVELTYN